MVDVAGKTAETLSARPMDIEEMGFFAPGADKPDIAIVYADACCVDMDLRATRSGSHVLDVPKTPANRRALDTLSARIARKGASLADALGVLAAEIASEVAACRDLGIPVPEGFRPCDRNTPAGHEGLLAILAAHVARLRPSAGEAECAA